MSPIYYPNCEMLESRCTPSVNPVGFPPTAGMTVTLPDGMLVNIVPDADGHALDAVRYAHVDFGSTGVAPPIGSTQPEPPSVTPVILPPYQLLPERADILGLTITQKPDGSLSILIQRAAGLSEMISTDEGATFGPEHVLASLDPTTMPTPTTPPANAPPSPALLAGPPSPTVQPTLTNVGPQVSNDKVPLVAVAVNDGTGQALIAYLQQNTSTGQWQVLGTSPLSGPVRSEAYWYGV
jgi:hypothetical protein